MVSIGAPQKHEGVKEPNRFNANCRWKVPDRDEQGFCAEPGTTAPESGCCVVTMGRASTRWQQKCAEARDSKTCQRSAQMTYFNVFEKCYFFRFGEGATTRCDWRSGEDADCSSRYEPPTEPEPNGECVWNGKGGGDPNRMESKCSRLGFGECPDSRNCEWRGYGEGEWDENAFLIDIARSHSMQSLAVILGALIF